MSDIERVPSMRKTAKQGVPKKPRRDMARPANAHKPEKPVVPETAEMELERATEPVSAPEPELKDEPIESVPSMPEPEPEPEREPEPVAAEPESEPKPQQASEPQASAEESALGAKPVHNMRDMVRRVEGSWAAFRAAAVRFPLERMDEHLSEGGWTRKQMLAHIAAWHDLASDRLVKFFLGGQPVYLERETDAINASVARQAIGKTSGEVLKDMEMTYNRLHRQMSRLTDEQLGANDEWAAAIIAGNTFEHYDEHAADLYLPEAEPTAGRR
ncbi:MAG: DinB family protein [Chloroflexota bacterium]